MSDFFTRLAQRTLGLAPTLQPMLAPMFAQETQQMSDEPFETAIAVETAVRDDAEVRPTNANLGRSGEAGAVGIVPCAGPAATMLEGLSACDVGAGLAPAFGPLPNANVLESSIPTSSTTRASAKPEPFPHRSMPVPNPRSTSPQAAVDARVIAPAPTPQPVAETTFSVPEAPEHVHLETLIHEVITPTQSRRMPETIQLPQRATNGMKTANIPIVTTSAMVLHRIEQQTKMEQVAQPTPTIHVTIGRIEVRAIPPATPTAPTQRQSSGPAVQSLDDYLRQRVKGGH